jgi:hypothetical protein
LGSLCGFNFVFFCYGPIKLAHYKKKKLDLWGTPNSLIWNRIISTPSLWMVFPKNIVSSSVQFSNQIIFSPLIGNQLLELLPVILVCWRASIGPISPRVLFF